MSHLPEVGQWELESISAEPEADADEPKVRVVGRRRGSPVYDVKVHALGSKPRLSYTRRATIAGQYAMSAKRALRPPFSEEMQWHALRPESEGERGMAESIYFGLNSPAKRLEVEVVFPKNYRLLEPRVRVLPDAVYQFEALEDLRPRVHARGLVLSVDEEASTLKLTVTRPLLGLSYALSWLLP